MNAFCYHFLLEFRTSVRKKSVLAVNYLLPLGLYVMMGLIMGPIVPGFRDTMIPAMAGIAIMSATILSLPEPLVTAREAGIFRSYRINGVPAFSILVIPALTTIVHTAAVTVIIAATAPWLFGAMLPVNWPGFVAIVLVTAFACAGLGVLISVVSPSPGVALLWANLIFIPSMILSGMTGLPIRLLPTVVQKASQVLPATHGMNAFRGIAQNLQADFSPSGSLIVLAVGGLLSFFVAVYLFNWDWHNTARRGHPLLGLAALLPYVAGMFVLT